MRNTPPPPKTNANWGSPYTLQPVEDATATLPNFCYICFFFPQHMKFSECSPYREGRVINKNKIDSSKKIFLLIFLQKKIICIKQRINISVDLKNPLYLPVWQNHNVDIDHQQHIRFASKVSQQQEIIKLTSQSHGFPTRTTNSIDNCLLSIKWLH